MAEPFLFPRPRHLAVATGEVVAVTTDVDRRHTPGLPPQGYELRVADHTVELQYADDAGHRYGEQTWQQLCTQFADGVPALTIRDWPDFATRGYMLDISRDRVPTRETLQRLVELLALCRFNHFELYCEHTFAYRDHEVVWRDASPITVGDLAWLDALCRDRGIELSVNQNCFGHMERWLRHPEYRDRAESPEGWRSKLGGQMPPAVLEPTPANAEFALSLVREQLEYVTSRRVNIGCDETFELGMGRSSEAVAAQGRGRVYFDQLRRLIDPLRDDGYEVMFWGDILRSHPELVRELPREQSVALVWHYEAPIDPALIPPPLLEIGAEFGITADVLRGFSAQIGAFVDSGFPHWVCPGTSSWNSLIGRLENAKANLLQAAEVGLGSGASGFLITDWGDNGHLQPPSISFPPLVYGAGLSWCGESNRGLDIAATLDRFVFSDTSHELGRVFDVIGNVYSGTGKFGFNGSPLFTALIKRGLLGSLGDTDAQGLAKVIDQLEESDAAVQRSTPSCSDGAIIKRELTQAIRLARHAAQRLAQESGLPSPSNDALRRELEQLVETQRATWLMRSRPGGLEDSLARLERVLSG